MYAQLAVVAARCMHALACMHGHGHTASAASAAACCQANGVRRVGFGSVLEAGSRTSGPPFYIHPPRAERCRPSQAAPAWPYRHHPSLKFAARCSGLTPPAHAERRRPPAALPAARGSFLAYVPAIHAPAIPSHSAQHARLPLFETRPHPPSQPLRCNLCSLHPPSPLVRSAPSTSHTSISGPPSSATPCPGSNRGMCASKVVQSRLRLASCTRKRSAPLAAAVATRKSPQIRTEESRHHECAIR